MNSVQQIAAWAKTLPPWQSDAIRRIFSQDTVLRSDEDEILGMLFAANGLADSSTVVPLPIPFSDIVGESTSSTRNVLLKEIHSVDGVNALVPGQSIKFTLDGITIVYGENGSGKSGYARVFKHACHAREKSEPILPNVLKPARTKPTAVVELSVNEEDVAVRWTAGTAASELLREIAVFDSHCARVFVDDANEVVYLPYGLDVFGKLASLCKVLKDRIGILLQALPQRLSNQGDFAESTAAGRFVWTLSDKSDTRQIDLLGKLDEIQLVRLDQLRTLVASAKANPPKQRAAQLRRTKNRFEQLRAKITEIGNALSDESLANLKKLHQSASVAGLAEKLASTEAFKSEPLQAATGSDPWRLLFEAAKNFSEQVAYPSEEFPVVREEAFCLWCQQPLSDDAVRRLTRFQKYVLDDAAKRKAEADKLVSTVMATVQSLDLQHLERDQTLVDELLAHSESLATVIQEFFGQARDRRETVLQAAEHSNWDVITTAPRTILAPLDKSILDLEASAAEFDRADKPEELKKLSDELAELLDRERLGKHADEVRKYLADKRREAALRKCEKALDTTAITRFGSALMEQAVTQQLIKGLKGEMDFFSLKSVPVQLKKSGEKGKTKHQLTIQTIQSGARPSGVLSEGEQRVIALSSFLAELNTSGSPAPIIFDDPVSSLDHHFREKVAKRLVAEAKSRQVVVFTHDIVMLLAIEQECGEQQVRMLVQTIRRSAHGPGECPPSPSRPWHACSTSQRIGFLKQATARFKKLSIESPNEYRSSGAEVYGKLREAWERAIEEVLLNGVVQRFRPSIETKKLKRVSIEPTDYVLIDQEMSKCSTWLTGHDSAAAISASFPTPDDIDADIKKLEEFVALLKKRSDNVDKEADRLINPPAARVSDKRAEKVFESSALGS